MSFSPLRPAPLPRFAIAFQRWPADPARPERTVVVESYSLDGAGRIIRRYLGDDAPHRPARYRLSCAGQVLPSPFASADGGEDDEPGFFPAVVPPVRSAER